MLTLARSQHDAILATCIRALPNEGCGLLLGQPTGVVRQVSATTNVANSAKRYEIDSQDLLRATREADSNSLEILGVFHSHTHSDAYPSETDVREAPDPTWHYVIVSLRLRPSVLRSYRIVDGSITEETVTLVND